MKLSTTAFSFTAGSDRTVERDLFHGFYALTANEPTKVKGQQAVYTQMWMSGALPNVLATAFSLVGIEQIVRPLPYELLAPVNFLNFENIDPDQTVSSADSFFARVFQDAYGVQPTGNMGKIDKDALFVIVDPHLLSDRILSEMASQLTGKKVLLILPEDELVPVPLLEIATYGLAELETGNPFPFHQINEVFPSNALAPFANASLEEAVLSRQATKFVVAGAGDRLLPTVIGVCDTVLQNLDSVDKLTNDERRMACREWVTYLPLENQLGGRFQTWCAFSDDWFPSGQPSFAEALHALLQWVGINADPISPDENLNATTIPNTFRIAPLWEAL